MVKTCPVCGLGKLSDVEDLIETKYGMVLMVFSVCDECEIEITLPEQIDKNANEFKKMKE
jgi:C4-type Zn-finger protein